MKSPEPYGRYLATGSILSSQICVGWSIDWCTRDAESLVTEALLSDESDRRRIWLCSYPCALSAKKGLHCKRPLTVNIKRTPRTGSYPLELDLPDYKITDHESGALDFKLRTTQWFTGSVIWKENVAGKWLHVPWGWVAITQGRGRAAPIRLNNHIMLYRIISGHQVYMCVISLNSHQLIQKQSIIKL